MLFLFPHRGRAGANGQRTGCRARHFRGAWKDSRNYHVCSCTSLLLGLGGRNTAHPSTKATHPVTVLKRTGIRPSHATGSPGGDPGQQRRTGGRLCSDILPLLVFPATLICTCAGEVLYEVPRRNTTSLVVLSNRNQNDKDSTAPGRLRLGQRIAQDGPISEAVSPVFPASVLGMRAM